jgi:hypothetical protein
MIQDKINPSITHVKHGHKIKLEFSGLRTPQLNGKVEHKSQIFYGRIKVALNDGGLEDSVRTDV